MVGSSLGAGAEVEAEAEAEEASQARMWWWSLIGMKVSEEAREPTQVMW